MPSSDIRARARSARSRNMRPTLPTSDGGSRLSGGGRRPPGARSSSAGSIGRPANTVHVSTPKRSDRSRTWSAISTAVPRRKNGVASISSRLSGISAPHSASSPSAVAPPIVGDAEELDERLEPKRLRPITRQVADEGDPVGDGVGREVGELGRAVHVGEAGEPDDVRVAGRDAQDGLAIPRPPTAGSDGSASARRSAR